jgi:hypothetical protein
LAALHFVHEKIGNLMIIPRILGEVRQTFVLASFTLSTFCLGMNTAALAVSADLIVDTIGKEHIVSTPVNAKIDNGNVTISTFLNKLASEKDLKIVAALMARKVIDLAPDEIARVTVYFYNTTLSKYKVVSVTAGDVKAFGSGDVNQEQLLSSLVLQDGHVSDPNNKMAAFLQSSKERADRPIHTKIKGPVLEVTAEIEPWVGDRELKMEALRLAERASQVASPSVLKIQINFVDSADPKKIRQLTTDLVTVSSIHNGIETLLQPLQIAEIKTDAASQARVDRNFGAENIVVQSISVVPGFALDERQKVLERMKGLDKLGVGMTPFLDAFLAIEEDAKNGEDNKITEGVANLNSLLDEQERAHKSAQEFVPEPLKTGAGAPKPTVSSASAFDRDSNSAYPPEIARNVLADPQSWIAYYRKRWYRKGHTPEDFPNYVHLLDFFGQTLRAAERIPEAEVYENQAAAIRARKQEDSKSKAAPPD